RQSRRVGGCRAPWLGIVLAPWPGCPRASTAFFGCWSGDPRDLHSFPTRRSSDLVMLPLLILALTNKLLYSTIENPATVPGFSIRSEEHTSELQSRENLVCRLLLEKKKHPGEDGGDVMHDLLPTHDLAVFRNLPSC